LSEKVCAVCGKPLTPEEIRIIQLTRRSPMRRSRYLCADCRKKEYERYLKEVKELVEKEGRS
jgi:hypothetical protein